MPFGKIAGAAASAFGAKKGADAAKDAAKEAAKAFKPYNVTGPLGSVRKKGNEITVGLSGDALGMLSQFREEATGSLDERAADVYGKMAALSAEDDEFARSRTRDLLFRSGRLGTAGGIREIGEVERALANARVTRELEAMSFANNLRQSAFGNYLALGQVPGSNLGPLALNRNPAAPVAASGYIGAGAARGTAISGFGQALGSAIGDINFGSIGDSIASIFGGGGQSGGVYENMGGFAGPPQEYMGPPAFLR